MASVSMSFTGVSPELFELITGMSIEEFERQGGVVAMSDRPIALHTITQHDAAHVLYVLSTGEDAAMEPGGFTTKLIEAALSADQSNMERLERGFEGLISAVRAYKELPDGLTLLRKTAMAGTPF